jgi:putative hydrolase of the HAD superfamily
MLDVRTPFTHFIFSDEVLHVKPDKEIWQLLVDTNELKPEEIVHVGDSYRMDYNGARAAGLQAVLFGRQESLPAATLAIDSLIELAPAIEEMNR